MGPALIPEQMPRPENLPPLPGSKTPPGVSDPVIPLRPPPKLPFPPKAPALMLPYDPRPPSFLPSPRPQMIVDARGLGYPGDCVCDRDDTGPNVSGASVGTFGDAAHRPACHAGCWHSSSPSAFSFKDQSAPRVGSPTLPNLLGHSMPAMVDGAEGARELLPAFSHGPTEQDAPALSDRRSGADSRILAQPRRGSAHDGRRNGALRAARDAAQDRRWL